MKLASEARVLGAFEILGHDFLGKAIGTVNGKRSAGGAPANDAVILLISQHLHELQKNK